MPALHQQLAASRHALAILVGKAPAEWSPPDFALKDFALPAEIPAALPSELAPVGLISSRLKRSCMRPVPRSG
jgi:outer membrane protein TolC